MDSVHRVAATYILLVTAFSIRSLCLDY